MFKVGDKIVPKDGKWTCGTAEARAADYAIVTNISSSGVLSYDIFRGDIRVDDCWMCQSERNSKIAGYSFRDLFKVLEPHLPASLVTTPIGAHITAYRRGDTYLYVNIDGIALDLSASSSGVIEASPTAQTHIKETMRLISEYEESIKPVEFTLEEIASKMGVSVEKLRIKE